MIFSSQHIIMECLSLEEENIIKYIRNPFGQKEEQNYLLLLIEFSICQIFFRLSMMSFKYGLTF